MNSETGLVLIVVLAAAVALGVLWIFVRSLSRDDRESGDQ